jgi:hypothetical protein
MKKIVRVSLALGIGFGLAILSMAITIYFGYVHAYSSEENIRDVYLFGIKIYRLTLEGKKYTGTSLGKNMGIICAIYMGIVFALEEIIHKLRSL